MKKKTKILSILFIAASIVFVFLYGITYLGNKPRYTLKLHITQTPMGPEDIVEEQNTPQEITNTEPAAPMSENEEHLTQ